MTENGVFDPATIWRLVEREGALILVIVGDAMAKPLIDELATGEYDASSCWIIASSGAVLSDASKRRLLELLPDRTIVDSFGSSETGVLGPRDQESGAFQLNEWTAVLGEDGRPVEPGSGARGRLARRGHVPLRYLNDPEKTAETFVEIDGERWALIGDEATVDEDGRVRVLGRGSQSINTGGEKVYPEEVETALKELDAVEDVVVVGVPDERWGERVVAVAQLRDELTLDELQEHARAHLASYKIPRDLVVVEQVERSPAGKPDYQWAKQVASDGTVED